MTVSIKNYHREKFWDDYAENFTDDVALLRYEGPIPVFLYGHYSTFDWVNRLMKRKDCEHHKDFRLHSGRACTVKDHLFLNERSKPTDDTYGSFMIPATCTIEGRKHLTKHRVRGSIFTVSLKGIKVLDNYFRQGSNFWRDTIKLEPDVSANFKSAYTYIVSPKLIASNSDEDKLRIKSMYNLEVPPRVQGTTGGVVYI